MRLLTVPLDYRDPSGATIEIAVLKVPAADPRSRLGSLVINPGGPGEPGTSYAALGAQAFGQPLLDHFDLVGLRPARHRRQLAGRLPERRRPRPATSGPTRSRPRRASVASLRVTQHQLATGCSRLSGALASHLSTVEAAKDMDILRAALGDGALNYFGASYGTKLGATYAQLFPHRVGRFVLDGAVDVSLGTRRLTLQQAAGFQRALEAYAANCVAPRAAASSATACPRCSGPSAP